MPVDSTRIRFVRLVSISFLLVACDFCDAQSGLDANRYRALRPSYQANDRLYAGEVRQRFARPAYRLDAGDVVAVVVFGVTGAYSEAPVHMPKEGDGTLPAVGHPMLVLRDGTLPMPLIDPVFVRGLTITQARDKISRSYLDQEILRKDRQVTLSLMRKRTINVSVLHDNPAMVSRSIAKVQIPAAGSRVIHALAAGGPFDADAQVQILRRSSQRSSPIHRDQNLRSGDVVQLRSQPAAQFFTGGKLSGGVFPLPSSRPTSVLQAIAIAGGIQPRQGMIGTTQATIVRRNGGATTVPYAQLLRNPDAWIIRSGDTLIVR